ncbi:MAG: autotransporter-associated beta strand repeat protein, partial [Phycisphaerales bacterium]|nr:autotransporter-associated beta strand repeat protein [Phycisphaerales bacterium]
MPVSLYRCARWSAVAAALFAGRQVKSDTVVWQGGTPPTWENNAGWNTGMLPTAGSQVVIPSVGAGNLAVNAAHTVSSIQNHSILDVVGALDLSGNSAQGSFTSDNKILLDGGTISNAILTTGDKLYAGTATVNTLQNVYINDSYFTVQSSGGAAGSLYLTRGFSMGYFGVLDNGNFYDVLRFGADTAGGNVATIDGFKILSWGQISTDAGVGLALGPGMKLLPGSYAGTVSADFFTNNGTVGYGFTFSTGAFTNNGTMGSFNAQVSSFSNYGTINGVINVVTDSGGNLGSINTSGGSFRTPSSLTTAQIAGLRINGGWFQLTAPAIDNTATTLNLDTLTTNGGGALRLLNTNITGGTIIGSQRLQFGDNLNPGVSSTDTFTDVSIDNGFDFETRPVNATINGSFTTTGANPLISVGNNSSITLTDNQNGNGRTLANVTLSIDPGASLITPSKMSLTIASNAALNFNNNGGSTVSGAPKLQVQGDMLVSGGSPNLTFTGMDLENGVLEFSPGEYGQLNIGSTVLGTPYSLIHFGGVTHDTITSTVVLNVGTINSTNPGQIPFDKPSGTLAYSQLVATSSLDNAGTISATQGGALQVFAGSVAEFGNLFASGSKSFLEFHSPTMGYAALAGVSASSGGEVLLGTSLDLGGNTLNAASFADSSSLLTLEGTVSNGSLAVTPRMNFGNVTFTHLSFVGDTTLVTSPHRFDTNTNTGATFSFGPNVSFPTGSTLTLPVGTMTFLADTAGQPRVINNLNIQIGGATLSSANTDLIFGPGAVVTGYKSSFTNSIANLFPSGALINQGTINASGWPLRITSGGSIENDGVITDGANGQLQIGVGSSNGTLPFTNNGSLHLGPSHSGQFAHSVSTLRAGTITNTGTIDSGFGTPGTIQSRGGFGNYEGVIRAGTFKMTAGKFTNNGLSVSAMDQTGGVVDGVGLFTGSYHLEGGTLDP